MLICALQIFDVQNMELKDKSKRNDRSLMALLKRDSSDAKNENVRSTNCHGSQNLSSFGKTSVLCRDSQGDVRIAIV